MATESHPDDDNDDLKPEPLEAGIEDIPNTFPHGDNPHPPSESDAPVPG